MLRDQPDFILRQPPVRDLEHLEAGLATESGAIVLVAEHLIRNLAHLARMAAERNCALVLLTAGSLNLEFSELPAIRGVLRKNADAKQLLACLRAVAAGKMWSTAIAAAAPPNTPGSRILAQLSPREVRVMSGVSRGAKNIEIAHDLETSEQVIKNMLGRIYDLVGVSDRLELALFVLHHPELAEAAREAGQTSPEE